MQQWIPRTQTLEPKIWGQMGLRQGLYIGLGVSGAIFFLVALPPFGLGPRVVGGLLALAAGTVTGFLRIKGLSPERYLIHRLRFAICRLGIGIRATPAPPQSHASLCAAAPAQQQEAPAKPASGPSVARRKRATPTGVTPAARWSECVVEASPFGLGFYLIALGTMAAAIVYLAGRPLP